MKSSRHDIDVRIKKNAELYGNKSSNLMELNLLCQTLKDENIYIQIPEITPIEDKFIKDHLNKHAKEWESLWNEFVTLQSKNGKVLNTVTKEKLKKLKNMIKDCFDKHPLDVTSLLFHSLKKDDLLMVRSTGEEDTVDIANPGGNKSVSAIKMDVNAISKAMGIVVASYFSEKSITQRFLSGDTIKKEPFMPVLIQKMVGEKLEGEVDDKKIVASGVMYAEGAITRIDVAPGHGELIVNSKAPFDTYDVTQRGLVHAEIHKKPYRLVPSEIKDKDSKPKRTLIIKNNSTDLQNNPSLPSPIARSIARVGRAISDHYGMSMDVEFVYEADTKTLHIVQARPIPGLKSLIIPSAIQPEYWTKIKTDKSVEKIKAVVIASAGNQTKVIDNQNQILIADSIENALHRYLNKPNTDIRVVMVKQLSPSTSHEAAQFNAMGIPVLQGNIDAFQSLLTQSDLQLIVDVQHQTIVNWTKKILDKKMISSGLFVSSSSPKKTLLKMDFEHDKEIDERIKIYLDEKDNNPKGEKIFEKLTRCIETLEAAKCNDKNTSAFEALKTITRIFKKIASSKEAILANTPHKILFMPCILLLKLILR